jgi:hypothetical protein
MTDWWTGTIIFLLIDKVTNCYVIIVTLLLRHSIVTKCLNYHILQNSILAHIKQ